MQHFLENIKTALPVVWLGGRLKSANLQDTRWHTTPPSSWQDFPRSSWGQCSSLITQWGKKTHFAGKNQRHRHQLWCARSPPERHQFMPPATVQSSSDAHLTLRLFIRSQGFEERVQIQAARIKLSLLPWVDLSQPQMIWQESYTGKED